MSGRPIGEHAFLPAPATITYTLQFEQTEARIAAGMSIAEYESLPGTPAWVNPDDPTWSKCDVVMWWRMHNAIPAVSNDIQAREMKRKSGKRS